MITEPVLTQQSAKENRFNMQFISLATSIAMYLDVSKSDSKPINTIQQTNPSFTTVFGNTMYALAEQDKGAVYSYDVKTGKSISQQDVKGSPAHVGVNKDGTLLGVASYGGGVLTVFKTDPKSGEIGEKVMEETFKLDKPGYVPDRQEASHPHQVVFDDTKMYVPDLGADLIRVFNTESYKKETAIEMKPGCGPRHLVVADNMKKATKKEEKSTLLCVCELSSTVAIIENNKVTGEVPIDTSMAKDALKGGAGGAEIVKNGQNVYVSQRNPDEKKEGNGFIAHFSFKKGELTPLKNYPLEGKMPRHFEIDNKKMYVMLQDQKSMQIFNVKKDGSLDASPKKVEVGKGGACISFAK